jgi:hypothetical protein
MRIAAKKNKRFGRAERAQTSYFFMKLAKLCGDPRDVKKQEGALYMPPFA